MDKPKILIVEDEPIIAMDIKGRLQRLGYKVSAIADSGNSAIADAHQFAPDLILMDIQLEGDMNGIQAAIYIRQQFNIPVVFLTAHADNLTIEEAKLAHPFGYIVKPFESHDLKTAIEIALSRYQAELATQKALDRERRLNELKSLFVSIVSHELRNPLTSIQLALDMLKDPLGKLSPEIRLKRIKRAETSIVRITELLDDVLIIGDVESGSFKFQPSLLNISEWCSDLVEEFQNRQKVRSDIVLTIQTEYPTTSNFYYLDQKLLHHIVINLISNAIKYSPPQSQVKLNVICASDSVTFEVEDRGIGISEEDQVDLFSPFHRGKNVKQIPGTGLGLAIVKQCVEAHKGSITVKSKLGLGTTFMATLPQREPPPQNNLPQY